MCPECLKPFDMAHAELAKGRRFAEWKLLFMWAFFWFFVWIVNSLPVSPLLWALVGCNAISIIDVARAYWHERRAWRRFDAHHEEMHKARCPHE